MPIIHSGRVANCLYLLCKQMQYIQATLFFQFNSIEFCVSRSASSSKSSAYQLLSAYIESPPNFPSSRKGNPPSSRPRAEQEASATLRHLLPDLDSHSRQTFDSTTKTQSPRHDLRQSRFLLGIVATHRPDMLDGFPP
jgi:hypothetical protein